MPAARFIEYYDQVVAASKRSADRQEKARKAKKK